MAWRNGTSSAGYGLSAVNAKHIRCSEQTVTGRMVTNNGLFDGG